MSFSELIPIYTLNLTIVWNIYTIRPMNSNYLKDKVEELVNKVGRKEAFKRLVSADVSGAMADKLVAKNYSRNFSFDTAQLIIRVLKESDISLNDEAS